MSSTDSDRVSAFNAGDRLTCTVKAEPRAAAATKTIERLMRRDPAAKRGLKRAQKLRADRMNAYVRGGRMWYARERPARVVRAVRGQTWTMVFTHDIAPDLRSVERYLDLKVAK